MPLQRAFTIYNDEGKAGHLGGGGSSQPYGKVKLNLDRCLMESAFSVPPQIHVALFFFQQKI